MGRDADHRVIERRNRVPAVVEQSGEAVDVGDEARLTRIGRGAPEAGMGVKHGQERQADPGLLRGGRDRGWPSRRDWKTAAAAVVVHVVKFTDASEAGFQHLHVGESGDGLHVVSADGVDKPVHGFSP